MASKKSKNVKGIITNTSKQAINAFGALMQGSKSWAPQRNKSQSRLKESDVICRTCFIKSNGSMIVLMKEVSIINHYHTAQQKYKRQQKQQQQWSQHLQSNNTASSENNKNSDNVIIAKIDRRIKPSFAHNIEDNQLFFRVAADGQPIFEIITYYDQKYNVINYTNYRKLKKKDRMMRTVVVDRDQALQTTTNTDISKLKEDSKEKDKNDSNRPQVVAESNANENINSGDSSECDEFKLNVEESDHDEAIPSLTILSMFDNIKNNSQTLREKSEKLKIDIQNQEKELINSLQTLQNINESLSSICGQNDNGTSDDIELNLQHLINDLMRKKQLEMRLNEIKCNTIFNLALKNYNEGIRIKHVKLNQNQFDRMCNAQFFNPHKPIRCLSRDIVDLTPKHDGFYCVDFIYCMYCCNQFNREPNVFGDRSFENGFAFVKPMEMNRQVWDRVSCCVPNHLTLSASHTNKRISKKTGTSRELTVMRNI